MIVVVMGVAGAGKTTVGQMLAGALDFAFVDADAFHPEASRAKMRLGVPLDERDRAPWLRDLAAAIEGWAREGRDVVLACSALRRAYRRQLLPGGVEARLVYLTGDPALLRERLEQRAGHFATAALLESQLATLEPPDDAAVTVDVAAPPAVLVDAIRAALHLRERREADAVSR